jgi:hypothetical protein
MKKDPLHKIKHLKSMAKFMAKNVALDCGFSIKELKQFMTVNNAINIIKENAKKDKDGNLLVNEKIIEKIHFEISSWLIGVNLAKLAAQDLLDCFWDEKKNCMIFSKKESSS